MLGVFFHSASCAFVKLGLVAPVRSFPSGFQLGAVWVQTYSVAKCRDTLDNEDL